MVKRRKTCSWDDAAVGIEPDAGFGSVSLTTRGSDGVILAEDSERPTTRFQRDPRTPETCAPMHQRPRVWPSAPHCSMGNWTWPDGTGRTDPVTEKPPGSGVSLQWYLRRSPQWGMCSGSSPAASCRFPLLRLVRNNISPSRKYSTSFGH